MRESVDTIRNNSQSEFMMDTHYQASAHGSKNESWSVEKPLFFWIRLVMGGVFVLASLDKILQPFAFAKSISNYQILPERLVNVAAIILPWVELILGFLLIFGIWLPGAILLINLLLAVFFTALVFNMARGLHVDCGCFTLGASERSSTPWYLLRDTVFLLLAGYLFYQVLIKPPNSVNK